MYQLENMDEKTKLHLEIFVLFRILDVRECILNRKNKQRPPEPIISLKHCLL